MIFDLIPHPHKSYSVVLIPTHNSPLDAVEINALLEDCFPYNNHTYHLDLWCFNTCCWDGYDNAIEFF